MSKRLRAWGLPDGLNMRMRLLGGAVERFSESEEADGTVDVLAEDGLSGFEIAGDHAGDSLGEQGDLLPQISTTEN